MSLLRSWRNRLPHVSPACGLNRMSTMTPWRKSPSSATVKPGAWLSGTSIRGLSFLDKGRKRRKRVSLTHSLLSAP